MASLNVYEMVTERIIKQLEQGTIPWQNLGLVFGLVHSTELAKSLTAL